MSVQTGAAPVFVLAVLAPQEAHLEPSVLNATAGGCARNTHTSVDPLPTGGRGLTLLLKGQSHLSLLFFFVS